MNEPRGRGYGGMGGGCTVKFGQPLPKCLCLVYNAATDLQIVYKGPGCLTLSLPVPKILQSCLPVLTLTLTVANTL